MRTARNSGKESRHLGFQIILSQDVCPGGALNFFQVGVCGPDFRSGAAGGGELVN